MKYIVISDIHGGLENLKKVLEIYEYTKCDKIIILGDLFNYGIDYNREYIIEILNKNKNNILCVRGNCDNYIDEIDFDMPYVLDININKYKAFLTHGHLYDIKDLLNKSCDIIITGHSHTPVIEKVNNKLVLNPGSIFKSRKGPNSFILVSEEEITLRNLDNEILETYIF